jgi:DNA (cytosine-5)-methyltransferase 1
MKLTTVDLFAGGGGLTLGFMSAGYDIVAAFDNWDPAIFLYKSNFHQHPFIKCDLSILAAIKSIKRYSPNIIIGGPPCQDFSPAGKRDESLGRADLTISYASIINKVRPRYFIMENVERTAKSSAFKKAKDIFIKSNYGLSVRVLDACLCGAPQLRKRLFVVGELNGADGFLDKLLDDNLAAKPMTIREYFGDRLGVEHYYRHPRTYARRGIFSVDEPSPTVRGVNRPIPAGYSGHPGDTAPVTRKVRPLTTKERSMIQTFPESFVLCGNKTETEQIIGNAVPVKLAEYVAKRLLEYLIGSGITKPAEVAKKPIRFPEPPQKELRLA